VKFVFIYVLKCPITECIRYVGKTSNSLTRLKFHLTYATRGKSRRAIWIRSLLSRNLQPKLEVIDEVPEFEWQAWEAAYIQFYRDQGCNLVNGTDGGEGGSLPGKLHPSFGKKMPAIWRAKISAVTAGEKNPMFGRTGEKSPHFGKKQSKEHRMKNAASHYGKKHSAETLLKMSRSVALYWEKRRQAEILHEMWD
jgi:hypothetical protein